MHSRYICTDKTPATMSDGRRRGENDPTLISVFLCFIAPERGVRWQRQWTQYYLFWNSEKCRASPTVGQWLTRIPIFTRSPLWAGFSHASSLTFHLTHPTVSSCTAEMMFLLLVLQSICFFCFVLFCLFSDWEYLEVVTHGWSRVEFQAFWSDDVFIKLQTSDLHWPA